MSAATESSVPEKDASPSAPPPIASAPLSARLKSDLPAGLVVFLVSLPLCLGIALASGAPLLSGLIAGVVAGLIISPLSGSPLSVSGPAAGLTVIVLNALAQLGSFRTFLMAVVLGGVGQLLLGVARAGVLVNFVPSSVIKGMLSAIGLVLILKQIPHAVGYDSTPEADEELGGVGGMAFEYNQAMHGVGTGAITVALVSLLILIFWPRLTQRHAHSGFGKALSMVPSALIVVGVGVVLNQVLGLISAPLQIKPEHLVALPVPQRLGDLAGYVTFPDFSQLSNPRVYTVALTLTLVASLETLLCIEAVDRLDPQRRQSNTRRELFAQGAGNIASGMLGGLPITSVIVRSAANINAGGRSRMSSFIHGVFLLVSALLLARFLNLVPLSCLAAVLLFTGARLATPALFRGMFRAGWDQFIPFLVTIGVILVTDLLKGIGAGMVVALVWFGGPIVRALRAGELLRPFRVEGAGATQVRIVLGANVTFLAKNALLGELAKVPAGGTIEIDGRQSAFVDYDIIESLQGYRLKAADRSIHLELTGVRSIAVAAGAHLSVPGGCRKFGPTPGPVASGQGCRPTGLPTS